MNEIKHNLYDKVKIFVYVYLFIMVLKFLTSFIFTFNTSEQLNDYFYKKFKRCLKIIMLFINKNEMDTMKMVIKKCCVILTYKRKTSNTYGYGITNNYWKFHKNECIMYVWIR